MTGREPSNESVQRGLAGLGIAAVAAVCCAALPVLLALGGSVAIGTVLGVGAGLAAGLLLAVAVVAGLRRRHPPDR